MYSYTGADRFLEEPKKTKLEPDYTDDRQIKS